MATTVTWKNDYGNTCVLTIQDGSESTTTLTPASEPFTTSVQESDDIFTQIRSGNGYIRVVVDSVDDISYLVGSAPLNRAVELRVSNVIRWVGFLACETFTQPWDKGPLELELPVVSPLEVLKGVYPSSDLSALHYVNFARIIYDMHAALGSPYERFYFPNVSEPVTTLKYQFDMKNYATSIDKNTGHETASYYDILEDICKLFGWAVVENENWLVFMCPDCKVSIGSSIWKGYNAADLNTIGDGGSSSARYTPLTQKITPEIYGADHDMTWLAGRKSVEAVGVLNEMDETIWSMDVIGQCVYKGSDGASAGSTQELNYYIKKYGVYQSEGASAPNGNIQVYNSIYGMAAPDVNGNNIKYTNWHNNNENAYGGSIGYEQNYWADQYGDVTQGQDTWVTRLILKAYSAGDTVIRIQTNFNYTPTQNAQPTPTPNEAFVIEGNLMYAATRQDLFAKTTGTHYVKAMLLIEGTNTYYWSPQNGWTTTAASFLMQVKEGEISAFGYYTNNRTLMLYPNIPVPKNISGQVTLNLIAATSNDIENWPGSAYLAYEDFKIKIVPTQNTRGAIKIEDKEQRKDENKKKINLNNGFTDSWSQECGLTLARENLPDSYGVVLAADKTLPSSLYNSQWPEDALADRASSYYGRSRLRIRAIVKKLSTAVSNLSLYRFTPNGQLYVCIEQQHNWRTDEVIANFWEPTYNTL